MIFFVWISCDVVGRKSNVRGLFEISQVIVRPTKNENGREKKRKEKNRKEKKRKEKKRKEKKRKEKKQK